MSEELFELRNYFYLGNYANALTEGETVHLDDRAAQIERDVILRRIAMEQGKYGDVIGAIDADSSDTLPVHKALRHLCQYIDPATDFSATQLKSNIDTLCQSFPTPAEMGKDHLFCAVAAACYVHANETDAALKTAHSCTGSLEPLSASVQALLAMDRADVAERDEIPAMKSIDEDNTLSQIAQAFVHLTTGARAADKEALQEALYIYQDLLERHGATDSILNGIAACHLAMGNPGQADKVLSEALTKNPSCVISLINSIATAPARNKPAQLVQRYFQQLVSVAPHSKWLNQYRQKESEFDQIAQQMEAETSAAAA